MKKYKEYKAVTEANVVVDKACDGDDMINIAIPKKLFEALISDNGRVMSLPIFLMADIMYDYRTRTVYPEGGGDPIRVRKFDGDILQRSLRQLQDKFGFSKNGIQKALKWLEDHKYIRQELRTVYSGSSKLTNVRHIEPVVSTLKKVFDIPNNDTNDPITLSGTPYMPKCNRNTQSTTQSLKDKQGTPKSLRDSEVPDSAFHGNSSIEEAAVSGDDSVVLDVADVAVDPCNADDLSDLPIDILSCPDVAADQAADATADVAVDTTNAFDHDTPDAAATSDGLELLQSHAKAPKLEKLYPVFNDHFLTYRAVTKKQRLSPGMDNAAYAGIDASSFIHAAKYKPGAGSPKNVKAIITMLIRFPTGTWPALDAIRKQVYNGATLGKHWNQLAELYRCNTRHRGWNLDKGSWNHAMGKRYAAVWE